MEFSLTVEIDAPPQRVWAVLAAVERWPEWTPSMSKVELLDGAFRAGARARIKQPKLPPATWRVTSFDAGNSFEWVSRAPGLSMVASHRIDQLASGRSRVTLSIESSGILAALLAPVLGRMGRRYVSMEAAGLKRAVESG